MATEFVGIELELRGAEGVYRDLQNIDRVLNTLGGRKQVKSGLTDLKKDIVATRGEIEKLERQHKQYQNTVAQTGAKARTAMNKMNSAFEKFGDAYKKSSASNFLKDAARDANEAYRQAKKDLAGNSAAIQNAKMQLKDLQQAEREVQAATRNMGKTMMQEFNSISSKIAHFGGAMQSLGNALTRLTSPFTRLTTGLLYGAGYKALNLITEGFSGAFERADVMANYSRTLEAFGFSADKAQASIEELNESVLGLPTGLDEIVALQKKYVAASQDLEKSTGLAIASNNAFLASASDARQQKVAERILSQLVGGAEIASTSWDALQRAIPLVFTELAKDSKMGVSDYMAALKSGKVSTDEFIESFTRLGKGGAIADAANVMKKSWAGLSANITNATKRMGEGIIKSLNEVFQNETGRTLLETLLGIDADGNATGDGIKDWINGISESVQNWIKSNPDKIIDFFNKLKAIDWKGLLKGIAEGMGMFLEVIDALAGLAGKVGLEKVGKWLPRLNIIGRGLTIFGGIFKGTRHPLAGIWVLGKFLGKKGLGKLGKLGVFGKLASIFGKKKDIDAAGDAAKAVPSISTTFKSAFASLEGVMKAAGAVVLVSGAGFVAFKSVRSILKDLSAISEELKGMTWLDAVHGANIIMGIGVMIKIFQYVGTALGTQGLLATAIASAASMLVTGSLWADTELIKQGLRNINDTIKEIDNIANSISNMQGFTSLGADAKQKISDSIDTIREVANLLVGQNGGPSSRGEYSQGLPMFVGMRANGVKSIAQAIKSMQDIVTNINKLSEMTINAEGVNGKLDEIGRVIDQVFKALPRLVRGTAGAANLNTSATNFANALIGIRRMAYHINKLAGTDVNTEGFGVFVQNLKVALAKLKALGEDISLDIEVKLAPGFNRSVKTVLTKINNARRDIQNAINKIPSTYTKNVTIRINANVLSAGVSGIASVGANIVSGIANSVHPAMGGYIYRARGGSVGHPGRPRGSDKIPAWLTAGEYVQNKRAVDTFGIDFMRKVNNLDVKGAMNELMHRAGGMANINRGTSIVNNNYNNQKVVINNGNSAGAGFTFKSASRFVGAF